MQLSKYVKGISFFVFFPLRVFIRFSTINIKIERRALAIKVKQCKEELVVELESLKGNPTLPPFIPTPLIINILNNFQSPRLFGTRE